MELTKHVWCEFGIGQGFDFDVNLTEIEMRELVYHCYCLIVTTQHPCHE